MKLSLLMMGSRRDLSLS